jgi:hypothetical protein
LVYGEDQSTERSRKMKITARSMTELLSKIYKAEGWKRVAGESRTIRAKELYKLSMEYRPNRFTAVKQ